MEDIEVSFPLQLCEDLLQRSENPSWRFYQASISPLKNGHLVMGVVKTRVVASDAGLIVDLVLTFSRKAALPVKGKICPRVEHLKALDDEGEIDLLLRAIEQETKSSSQSESSKQSTTQHSRHKQTKIAKSQLHQTLIRNPVHSQEVEEENDNCAEKVFGTEKDPDTVEQDSRSFTAILSVPDNSPAQTQRTRSSRKRKIPPRFKEFVSTSSLLHPADKHASRDVVLESTHSELEEPDSDGDDSYDNSQSSNFKEVQLAPARVLQVHRRPSNPRKTVTAFLQNQANVTTSSPSGSPPLKKKSVKRKYDALIAHLQKATASSGQVMKSLIADYNPDADAAIMNVLPTPNSKGKNAMSDFAAWSHDTDFTNNSLRTWTSFQRKFPSSLMRTQKELLARKEELQKKNNSAISSSPCSSTESSQVGHGDGGSGTGKTTTAKSQTLAGKTPGVSTQDVLASTATSATSTTKPASADSDHNYMDLVAKKNWMYSSKPLKTLTKSITASQHIQARVERVEEGEGTSLVTISGLNSRASRTRCRTGVQQSPQLTNREGLPIASSLDDTMTDTIKRRKKQQESYDMALQIKQPSSPSAETVDLTDMPVVNEVVLSANRPPVSRTPKTRTRKPSLVEPAGENVNELIATSGCEDEGHQTVETIMDENGQIFLNYVENFVDVPAANHIVIEITPDGLAEVLGQGQCQGQIESSSQEVEQGEGSGVEDSFSQRDTFSHGDSFSQGDVAEESLVAIENDVKDSNQQTPSRVCKYCLRAFTSPIQLYRHVIRYHTPTEGNEEHKAYMKELRKDNCMSCPYCPPGTILSSRYKLRDHVLSLHPERMGSDKDIEGLEAVIAPVRCEICEVHFNSQSELSAHATLLHNTSLVSCTQCSTAFVTDEGLEQHVARSHTTQSALYCTACGLLFNHKRSLNAHRYKAHSLQAQSDNNVATTKRGRISSSKQSQSSPSSSSYEVIVTHPQDHNTITSSASSPGNIITIMTNSNQEIIEIVNGSNQTRQTIEAVEDSNNQGEDFNQQGESIEAIEDSNSQETMEDNQLTACPFCSCVVCGNAELKIHLSQEHGFSGDLVDESSALSHHEQGGEVVIENEVRTEISEHSLVSQPDDVGLETVVIMQTPSPSLVSSPLPPHHPHHPPPHHPPHHPPPQRMVSLLRPLLKTVVVSQTPPLPPVFAPHRTVSLLRPPVRGTRGDHPSLPSWTVSSSQPSQPRKTSENYSRADIQTEQGVQNQETGVETTAGVEMESSQSKTSDEQNLICAEGDNDFGEEIIMQVALESSLGNNSGGVEIS